jgi:flagellar basal body rod protein FlgG
MDGMIDFSAPLSGMAQAETSVNQIATRLTQSANDSIDLSAEMVALIQSRNAFAINVRLAQTEDQMTQSALSILA